MKKLAIYSLIMLSLTACGDKDKKGEIANSDQVKTTPVPTRQQPQKPGAEVMFSVTNVVGAVSYLPQFRLTGDVVIPKSVNVASDLKIFTANFIPTGKRSMAARFEQDEAGDDTNGIIWGALGEYGFIGPLQDIVVIGDWQTTDIASDRKHLFINLYEDDLDYMAASHNLLWPTA